MKKWICVALAAVWLLTAPVSARALDFSGDVTEKSGYTAEELAEGLQGELPKLAAYFVAAEEKYGVNAVFLAGVAAWESGWGRCCFRENNFFGWGKKSFSSPEEGVDFVASKIAEYYLSPDGKYYHGVSVAAVNRAYNGSKLWEQKVSAIMASISEKAEIFRQKNGGLEPLTEETGRILLG